MLVAVLRLLLFSLLRVAVSVVWMRRIIVGQGGERLGEGDILRCGGGRHRVRDEDICGRLLLLLLRVIMIPGGRGCEVRRRIVIVTRGQVGVIAGQRGRDGVTSPVARVKC